MKQLIDILSIIRNNMYRLNRFLGVVKIAKRLKRSEKSIRLGINTLKAIGAPIYYDEFKGRHILDKKYQLLITEEMMVVINNRIS